MGKDELSWGWCTYGGSLWHAGGKALSSRGGQGAYRVYGVSKATALCDVSEIDLPIMAQRAKLAQRSAIKAGWFTLPGALRAKFKYR